MKQEFDPTSVLMLFAILFFTLMLYALYEFLTAKKKKPVEKLNNTCSIPRTISLTKCAAVETKVVKNIKMKAVSNEQPIDFKSRFNNVLIETNEDGIWRHAQYDAITNVVTIIS